MIDIKDAMTVDVPEGVSGNWSVVRKSLGHEDLWLANMKDPGRYIPEGQYTMLYKKKPWQECVMSDTPEEKRDHYGIIHKALDMKAKTVRLHGLGLGMVLQGLFETVPSIEKIDVIEISEDVINLVAPHYEEKYGNKVNIIQGDALTIDIPKGSRWNIVWHDIWTNISADNWETMKTLHRRFANRCDWQDSWQRQRVKYEVERDRRDRHWGY